MKLNSQTPKIALNKAFLKQRPVRSEIEQFKTNLKILLAKVEAKESEENKKNHVRDFLLDTYYKGANEVNTKDRKDLVIHLGKTNAEKVGVIIEAKTPESSDMVKREKLNTKAFHELVLYYFDERIGQQNSELKNLVITNIYEWFIFDANVFDKRIYQNTKIRRLYETKINDKKDNPFFYEELRKLLENLDETIDCTHFNLKDYQTFLNNEDLADDKNLIELQKILSPFHLLKTPFTNDSNSLNKPFYDELLHIIGLEEVKEKSKSIIRRKLEGNRNQGSLLENAITILQTKDSLRKVKNISDYGETSDERYFNVALELCITWINRILFLKLLESQLVGYHKGNRDFRFLNIDMIPDFDELFTLFHQVLAKTLLDRSEAVKLKFQLVPYLNSSLFEISELEDQTISIESLKDSFQLPFINSTVLKDLKTQGTIQHTIEYLFKFLDAYDFASEGVEAIQENNRSLINASILGKIFEKINGYKDGSIFTPSFITMYMCRQSIRLAVVQKFKEQYGWNIGEFSDIRNYLADRRSSTDIIEFNEVVNSIKLCDPAVGSGHFLVSSLNEIIAIKSELGILADENGSRLADFEIHIENDELIITDERGDFFSYQINDDGKPTAKAHKLQKALFHEKQTLIENCLFGVDINPNSVKICRLRLWIELLKNAYYKDVQSPRLSVPSPAKRGGEQTEVWTLNATQNFTELETLPNIDINIKCGNSLISRFALDEDLSQVLKTLKYNVNDYRNFVLGYKETRDREKKREFEDKIQQIKEDFKTEIFKHHPKMQELIKKERRLFEVNSPSLFDKYAEGEREAVSRNLEKEIAKIKDEIEAIKTNAIYRNAFEWRFEFPEVLDNDGNFLGFDIVIGNPPYIKEDENRKAFDGLHNKQCYKGKMDIWYLFGDLGLQLLKADAYLSLIATNNWVTNSGASKFRDIIISNSQILNLTDFGAYMVFDNASIQTMIMLFKNNSQIDNYKFDYRRLNGEKLQQENAFSLLNRIEGKNSVLLFPIIKREYLINKLFTFNTDENSKLLNKVKEKQNFTLREKADKKLKLKAEVGSGIDVLQDFVSNANVDKLNGIANVGDGVFVLSQNEFDEIEFSTKEKEIIKPYFTTERLQKYYGNSSNTHWIIYTKSDINKLNNKTNQIPINNFPNVKKHLDKYQKIITSDFKPYGLHRTREQHLFEGEKIFALRKCPKEPKFTYTEFNCFVSRAFLIIQTDRLNLKYLTGLLNSKLVAFWLRHKGKMQGNNYQLDKEPLLEIPIYEPSPEQQQPFIKLVDEILEKKKVGEETSELERQIDAMVYQLYELTDEEIKIVEGRSKSSESKL